MQVQSLFQEYSLEEEMATHNSILVWKNPMDRGAWLATVHRVAKSWTQQHARRCRFAVIIIIITKDMQSIVYLF